MINVSSLPSENLVMAVIVYVSLLLLAVRLVQRYYGDSNAVLQGLFGLFVTVLVFAVLVAAYQRLF